MVTCYIALGSNVGDRKKYIAQALEQLSSDTALSILKTSSIIETNPVGGPAQGKFLNCVCKLSTNYSALSLFKSLKKIECNLGRENAHLKNHPRTIDLDILLYADEKIKNEHLEVPHPRMWERDFVTIPLKEIAPELFRNRE